MRGRGGCAASGTSRSRSRSISDDLVIRPNGFRASCSTSSTERVIFRSRSTGWYASVLTPTAMTSGTYDALPSACLSSAAALTFANSRVSKSRPGDRAEVAVRGAREAVDAAVLATAVRVERDAERDVGRRVPRQDRLRVLLGDRGLQRHQVVDRGFDVRPGPPVVEALADVDLVTTPDIGDRPAAPGGLRRECQRPFDRLVRFAHRRVVRIRTVDRQVASALVCTSWHPPTFHFLSGCRFIVNSARQTRPSPSTS